MNLLPPSSRRCADSAAVRINGLHNGKPDPRAAGFLLRTGLCDKNAQKSASAPAPNADAVILDDDNTAFRRILQQCECSRLPA